MAQFYKVLKADPLGDPWESHGKMNQSFWCQVEGEELAVKINKQVPNIVQPGQNVYGNLMKAKSQKGTDYWQFKSEQVPDGVQRPADTPAQAQAQQATGVDKFVGDYIPAWFVPFGNTIIENNKILKELKGDDIMDAPLELNEPEEPTELVDEETKNVLDDIFSPPKDK
jgi:hypothetical protein